jgi:hypothetical protein
MRRCDRGLLLPALLALGFAGATAPARDLPGEPAGPAAVDVAVRPAQTAGAVTAGVPGEASSPQPPAGTPTAPTALPTQGPGTDPSKDLLSGCWLFRNGQKDQVVPPPSGWTVILPPFPPPPPKPGAPSPPPQPWKPLYFENDFTYLDRPNNTYHNTFDFLKRRRPFGEGFVYDIGGEFRLQMRGEDNRRMAGEQNNHTLYRQRLYLNTQFGDRFRMYWEGIAASSTRQTVPPIFFDINNGDVLNAFGEYYARREGATYTSIRYGWREELLFGNQRLVSPLDWANVRRTFDFVPHLLHRGKDWNFDLFWSRPNQIYARQLDQPIYGRQFYGLYATYKGTQNRLLDLYYLGFNQERDTFDPTATAPNTPLGFNGERGNQSVQTLGLRWAGTQDDWLWEVETAYQFGHHQNAGGALVARNAGMATAGLGRKFANLPFKPELWFYYDYASGNQDPNGGSFSTFNQLFPLGHKYFGYADLVARQNILDPNVNLKFFLGKRANLLLWYHNFQLASARAPLFNGAGVPYRVDPTGQAGRYVGDEIDVVLNFIVNPNADWQIGLAHFFAGSFIQNTAATPAQAQDANFFYTQLTVRF